MKDRKQLQSETAAVDPGGWRRDLSCRIWALSLQRRLAAPSGALRAAQRAPRTRAPKRVSARPGREAPLGEAAPAERTSSGPPDDPELHACVLRSACLIRRDADFYAKKNKPIKKIHRGEVMDAELNNGKKWSGRLGQSNEI